jgi:hypothetical protein
MDIDNHQITIMSLLVEKFEKMETKLNEFKKNILVKKITDYHLHATIVAN